MSSMERMQEQWSKIPEVDQLYLKLVKHLLSTHSLRDRELRGNRTAQRTVEDFGALLRFDLRQSFPLLQIKKTLTKSVIAELIGFLRGYQNVEQFHELGTSIWDEWADEHGRLGPIYGAQWRSWNGDDGFYIDQLAEAIDKIRNNPDDRRILVSAWRPDEIERMALPPCHYAFQFHCGRDNTLDLMWHQRSCDVFLGLPFNIASYGTLLEIVAKMTGRVARNLIGTLGDFHLYENQLDAADTIVKRYERMINGDPEYQISQSVKIDLDDRIADIDDPADVDTDNVSFSSYKPLPQIKVEVAV